MQAFVTVHAKDQYRRRMQRFSLSDNEIIGTLRAAAIRGTKQRKCPGDAWEVKYENFVIVVSYHKEQATVITCLGSIEYRGWSRRQEIFPRYRERRAV